MLTDKQIKALQPREKPYVMSDGRTAKGEGVLLLKIRPNGTKEYYFQRFVGGKKKLTKLGTWPEMKLTDARDKCREEKELVISAGTLQQLMDNYIAKLRVENAASVNDVESSFERYVTRPFPQMVGRPVAMIGPVEIRTIIAKMIDKGITTYCNRVRSQLHAAFQLGLEQEHNPRNYLQNKVQFGLMSNPVASIPVQADWEQPGNRALSVAELKSLWSLLPEQLSLVTSELIKFLIASGGQRPQQLLGTTRKQYFDDHLVIRNLKGGDGERILHAVPYNRLMRQSLKTLDEISETSLYRFMGRMEDRPLHTQSLSRAVTKLYSRHKKLFDGPFTLRDIRRTCKTLMGVAGLEKELRDRIQGHAFNDVSSKHYDRYDYFNEKVRGLQRWAAWIEENVATVE